MACVACYSCDLPKLALSLPFGCAPLVVAHFLIHFPLLPSIFKLSQQWQRPVQDSQHHAVVAHSLGRCKGEPVLLFKPGFAVIVLQMWQGDLLCVSPTFHAGVCAADT